MFNSGSVNCRHIGGDIALYSNDKENTVLIDYPRTSEEKLDHYKENNDECPTTKCPKSDRWVIYLLAGIIVMFLIFTFFNHRSRSDGDRDDGDDGGDDEDGGGDDEDYEDGDDDEDYEDYSSISNPDEHENMSPARTYVETIQLLSPAVYSPTPGATPTRRFTPRTPNMGSPASNRPQFTQLMIDTNPPIYSTLPE